MVKLLSLLVTVCILTGCSAFASTKQNVSVMTNVPDSKIYVNGNLAGMGQANVSVKRNRNVQVMAVKDGYYPAQTSIGKTISVTGILDIIGTFLFIVPVIGLFTPGMFSLDEDNVSLIMYPDPVNPPAAAVAK